MYSNAKTAAPYISISTTTLLSYETVTHRHSYVSTELPTKALNPRYFNYTHEALQKVWLLHGSTDIFSANAAFCSADSVRGALSHQLVSYCDQMNCAA